MPSYSRRDLRVVNNATRDWDGGFTVEYDDLILAGPYASKDDAKAAKEALLDGTQTPPRCVSEQLDREPEPPEPQIEDLADAAYEREGDR